MSTPGLQALDISDAETTGCRLLRATGHPVSGGRPKPTYLTSEPLVAGRLHALELTVKVKKSELRLGVINRPAYLQVVNDLGCARSFHSSQCASAVAYCVWWEKGAGIAMGKDFKEMLGNVTVSAGDKVRMELDRSDVSKPPKMRFKVNGADAGKFSLPAGWDDLCFGVQFFDHADEVVIIAEPDPFVDGVSVANGSEPGCRLLRATGHPVSGGGPKPTYLTSEPLVAGRLHALELTVKVKKSELRLGVINRPAYLQVVNDLGCARSFHSSQCASAVAYCVWWEKGAGIAMGKDFKEMLGNVTVSAGDKVRMELDRSDVSKPPKMRFKVNGADAGKFSLPAGWDDLCFGVQFFDHADEVVIIAEPDPFVDDVSVVIGQPQQSSRVPPPVAPLKSFPGGLLSQPHYWAAAGATKGRGAYQCFTLSTASTEYAEVMALFAATATASIYEVVSVRLVCNPNRFLLYQAQKETFVSRLGAGKLNERWLWHGTGTSLVVPILTNGFLRDYSAKAAYGDGTYFARDASYSLQTTYAKPDANGEQTLFLNRVLVGEPCKGKSGMKKPDLKPDGTTLHESLVDSLSDPKIFVMSAGSDHQAYAEFILLVKPK